MFLSGGFVLAGGVLAGRFELFLSSVCFSKKFVMIFCKENCVVGRQKE